MDQSIEMKRRSMTIFLIGPFGNTEGPLNWKHFLEDPKLDGIGIHTFYFGNLYWWQGNTSTVYEVAVKLRETILDVLEQDTGEITFVAWGLGGLALKMALPKLSQKNARFRMVIFVGVPTPDYTASGLWRSLFTYFGWQGGIWENSRTNPLLMSIDAKWREYLRSNPIRITHLIGLYDRVLVPSNLENTIVVPAGRAGLLTPSKDLASYLKAVLVRELGDNYDIPANVQISQDNRLSYDTSLRNEGTK